MKSIFVRFISNYCFLNSEKAVVPGFWIYCNTYKFHTIATTKLCSQQHLCLSTIDHSRQSTCLTCFERSQECCVTRAGKVYDTHTILVKTIIRARCSFRAKAVFPTGLECNFCRLGSKRSTNQSAVKVFLMEIVHRKRRHRHGCEDIQKSKAERKGFFKKPKNNNANIKQAQTEYRLCFKNNVPVFGLDHNFECHEFQSKLPAYLWAICFLRRFSRYI